MVMEAREVTEYGWPDASATCAHDYLTPVVERAIRTWLHGSNVAGLRVFDAGCGNGFVAARMHELGCDVAGCDASEQGIQHARHRLPGCRFEVTSLYEDLAARFGAEWDVVISTEVIEHLYDPRRFAANVRNLLKPGGLFVVTTPYHGYLKNLVLAVTGKLDAHFTALWDGGHIKFWSSKTLAFLLQESGFSNIVFFGAGRLPFLWKSMVLSGVR
jgi:2-polyprenyl-6-hydroxyphenyl methylase/3-demethylubiquinone-9 3-methyltransferase